MSSSDNNINQEFTNQSWDHMATLLDKEMPVKKNPNRYMFLLLCFGLLFMSGLAFYNVEAPNQFSNESELVTPMAQLSTSSSNTQLDDASTKRNDLSESSLMTPTQAETKKPMQLQKPLPSKAKKSAVNKSEVVKTSVVPNQQMAVDISSKSVDLNIQQLNKPTGSHSAKAVTKSSKINLPTLVLQADKKMQVQYIELLDNIDRLPIGGLTVEDRNKKQLSTPTSTHTIRHRKSVDVSLAIGGMMSTDFTYFGYGGMLKTDYNLSRKVALGVGIGLYQLSQNEEAVSSDLIDPFGPPGSIGDAISKTHYSNTTQLTDLVAPIMVEYKFTRRASIYGGVMMRWNMEKHFRNNPSRVTFPLSSTEVIYNNYFVNPLVGLNYKINRKFSFGLQYEKGVRSLINTDLFTEENNRLSFLNLNVVYTL